jgi:hypothetical protein
MLNLSQSGAYTLFVLVPLTVLIALFTTSYWTWELIDMARSQETPLQRPRWRDHLEHRHRGTIVYGHPTHV